MYVVTWYNHDDYEVGIVGVTKDWYKAQELLQQEKERFLEEYGGNVESESVDGDYCSLLGEQDEPCVELEIHPVEDID